MNFKKLIYSIIIITSFTLTDIFSTKIPLIVNGEAIEEDLIDFARDILDVGPDIVFVKLEPLEFVELKHRLSVYKRMLLRKDDEIIVISREDLKEFLEKKIIH